MVNGTKLQPDNTSFLNFFWSGWLGGQPSADQCWQGGGGGPNCAKSDWLIFWTLRNTVLPTRGKQHLRRWQTLFTRTAANALLKGYRKRQSGKCTKSLKSAYEDLTDPTSKKNWRVQLCYDAAFLLCPPLAGPGQISRHFEARWNLFTLLLTTCLVITIKTNETDVIGISLWLRAQYSFNPFVMHLVIRQEVTAALDMPGMPHRVGRRVFL